MAGQMVHLKREYNAYKSLNMIALANDVEVAIKKMEEDLIEDKKAIAHLQEVLSESMQRYGVCLNLSASGKMRGGRMFCVLHCAVQCCVAVKRIAK
jgi:hypothetical protein